MSLHVHSLVYSRRFGSTARKAVALKLGDVADDAGHSIFPSINCIAGEAEVSRSTVKRILRQFQVEGILILVKRGGSGPRSPNEYRMDLEVVWRLPPSWERAKQVGKKGVTVNPSDYGKGVTAGSQEGQGEPLKGATADPKQSKNDHRTSTRSRVRRLSSGVWKIPNGTAEFDAWQSWHCSNADYRAEAECRYCNSDGHIQRRSRWPRRP